LGVAEKVFSWRQGTGNSFSYLSSPHFGISWFQNARFFRYTLQKYCTFFLFINLKPLIYKGLRFIQQTLIENKQLRKNAFSALASELAKSGYKDKAVYC
jgi:hypothetical protein